MENEKTTRREIIDRRLKAAGWNVSDPTQVVQELFISVTPAAEAGVLHDPTTPYNSREFSDYGLLAKIGKPMAVVESKRTSKDAELGREQAKQYCHNLQAPGSFFKK